jgi:hypothetical protein
VQQIETAFSVAKRRSIYIYIYTTLKFLDLQRAPYIYDSRLKVKHTIRHDRFDVHNLAGLEASAVYLYTRQHCKLLSVVAYLPPTTALSATDLDYMLAQSDSVLIVGDLKSKHVSWKNNTVNRNGRELATYRIDNQVTLSCPDQRTYFSYHTAPSVIDIFLTKQCPLSKPKAVSAPSSDHNPVAFKILLRPTTYTPRIQYNYRQADWQLFSNNLDLTLDLDQPVHTTLDLDQDITTFERSVRQAARSAIPVLSANHNNLPLPPIVLAILKLNNYYRRNTQRARSPTYYQLYALYSRLFSTLFFPLRNKKWSSFLKTLQPQSLQLRKITRYFKNSPATIPPLTHFGTQVFTPHTRSKS